MAKLPEVTSVRPVPRPTRAIAGVSPAAAGAQGSALQAFGAEINLVGQQIQDREATAEAKAADARASDEIRRLLYDPETGFANLSGGAAVAARQSTLDRLNSLSGTLTEGMGGLAKRKAEDALRGRFERAQQFVDTHVSSERKTWINNASASRLESAYQDSLVNPGETENSLRIIEGEIRGTAAREGWSTEQTNLKLTTERSRVYRDQAIQIAQVDPSQAAAYLAENRDKMIGSDVVNLEAKLIPLAKEFEGRKIGAAAASGVPMYNHATQIEYAMGPARPNKPAAPVMSVIGKSVQDVLGAGARVVVTSGKEDEGKQHGSNRHGTGNAADVAIYRRDGTRVLATDPEMAAIARAAADNGALGIGFGAEYMGGSHIHVDLVPPGAGQANTWASGGKALRDDIIGRIAGRKAAADTGLPGLLEIEDPVTRAAAIDEYNLRAAVADGQRKAAQEAAKVQAFSIIERGGSVNDLSADDRVYLGPEVMASMRATERSIAAGVPVETDPAIYMMFRQMEANDPERFRVTNSLVYSNVLSKSDLKDIIDRQNKPRDVTGEMAASALMSTATAQLRAIGIKANDPKEAMVQTQLLQWQDGFIAAQGRKPSQLEIDQRVGRMLTEVVINPPGVWNEFSGRAFEAGDMRIGNMNVPAAVVQEQVDAIIAEGGTADYDTIAARITSLMGGN